MRGIFTLAFMLTTLFATAQENFNMTLISNLDYPEGCNDVWGYVAPDGTEYAILGTVEATAIISLADPTAPQEVAYIPGANSIWRDMKTWGNHIYVTTDEGADGLLVIDMANAPNNITWNFWQPTLNVNNQNSQLTTCHNIFIDENGFAYLSGCVNTNNGGVLIVDVHTTPGQPIYIGAAEGIYSHDNYVRGDTLWSSDIFEGVFSVHDLSDKTNVTKWNDQTTTTDFTHNAWLSDDGNYLFTTDERPNAFVDAYDVSDLSDIQLLDSYQPTVTAGNDVVPHNTHFFNNYLVTSWYTDGVVIVDAHKPENLVKVGAYDTFLGPHGGTEGCWGAYPWLPSGLILASDRQTGLYVFQPQYVRACYLEGQVTDEVTGAPINDVTVQLIANEAPEKSTNFMGDYKSGYATAGSYSVVFGKSGYEQKTIDNVSLENGETTILNTTLIPLEPFTVDINIFNEADGSPIFLGNVILMNEFDQFTLLSNAQGTVTQSLFNEGNYTAYVGAWGFLHKIDILVLDQNTGTVSIGLTPGYQDDFVFNFNWSSLGDAESGFWERAIPIGTNFQGGFSNVNQDLPFDIGEQCYLTENGTGGGVGEADVDNGTVILRSPVMDLTIYDVPEVRYTTWFFNDGGFGGAPDDELIVSIENGIEEVVLETITASSGSWRPESTFVVSDFLEVTNNMRIIFTTSDGAGNQGHLVEAGVDAFLVVEGEATSIAETDFDAFQLDAYPNPFSESLFVNYTLDDQLNNVRVKVFNALGQQVAEQSIRNSVGTIEIGAELERGLYFIQMLADEKQGKVIKVLKQ